jgi:hypothetical protein
MIQEPARRPYKRANRTKNRPVLVASTEQDAIVSSEQEGATSNSDSVVAIEMPLATSTTKEKTTTGPSRRLSGFFSTVGKKQQTETTTEADIAQARIARATRGKATAKAASTAESPKDETKAVVKPEPKKATAAKPAPRPSLFKTRYLIGMVVYLLAANFVGVFETNVFVSSGIDHLITSFTLFGGVVQIRTSTLAYLATLVVLLIVLAYFDLIPRSFSAITGQNPSAKRGISSTRQNTSDSPGAKNTPPPMRQGVKGADDDLYEEYRYSQRRSKKK